MGVDADTRVMQRLLELLASESESVRAMGVTATLAATRDAPGRAEALWRHLVDGVCTGDSAGRASALSAMCCLLSSEQGGRAAAGVAAAYAAALHRHASDGGVAEHLCAAAQPLQQSLRRVVCAGAELEAAAENLRAAACHEALSPPVRHAAALVHAPVAAASSGGSKAGMRWVVSTLQSLRIPLHRIAGALMLGCSLVSGDDERGALQLLDAALGVAHHAMFGDQTGPSPGERPGTPGAVRLIYPGRPDTPLSTTAGQRAGVHAAAPTSLAALYPGSAVNCGEGVLPARRGTAVDFLRSGRGHQAAAALAASRCSAGVSDVLESATRAASAAVLSPASVEQYLPAAAGQALALLQWEPLMPTDVREAGSESESEDEEDEEEEEEEEATDDGGGASVPTRAPPAPTDLVATESGAAARATAARLLSDVCRKAAGGVVAALHRPVCDARAATSLLDAVVAAALTDASPAESGDVLRSRPLFVTAASQHDATTRTFIEVWSQAIGSGALGQLLNDGSAEVRANAADALRNMLFAAAVRLRAEADTEEVLFTQPGVSVRSAVHATRAVDLLRCLRRRLRSAPLDEAVQAARCCTLIAETWDAAAETAYTRAAASAFCRTVGVVAERARECGAPLVLSGARMCASRSLQDHKLRTSAVDGIVELCSACGDLANAGNEVAVAALGSVARWRRGALAEQDPAMSIAVNVLVRRAKEGTGAVRRAAVHAALCVSAPPAPLVDYDLQREVCDAVARDWVRHTDLVDCIACGLSQSVPAALPPPQAADLFAVLTQQLEEGASAALSPRRHAPSLLDMLAPELQSTAAQLHWRRLSTVRAMRTLLRSRPGGIGGALLKRAMRVCLPFSHIQQGELCEESLLLFPEAVHVARPWSRRRISQYLMCLQEPRVVELMRLIPTSDSSLAAAVTEYHRMLGTEIETGDVCYTVSAVVAAALAAVGVRFPQIPRFVLQMARQQMRDSAASRPGTACSMASMVSSYGGDVPHFTEEHLTDEKVWQDALAEQLRLGAASSCGTHTVEIVGAAVAAVLTKVPGPETEFVLERLLEWAGGLQDDSVGPPDRARACAAAALRHLAPTPQTVSAVTFSTAELVHAQVYGDCVAAHAGATDSVAAAAAALIAAGGPDPTSLAVNLHAAAKAASDAEGDLPPSTAAELAAACCNLLAAAAPAAVHEAGLRCCAAVVLRRPGVCFERVLRPLCRESAGSGGARVACRVLTRTLATKVSVPPGGRAGSAAHAELAHHCAESLKSLLSPERDDDTLTASAGVLQLLPRTAASARVAAPVVAGAAPGLAALLRSLAGDGAPAPSPPSRGPKGVAVDESIEAELRAMFGDEQKGTRVSADAAAAVVAAAAALLRDPCAACGGASLAAVCGVAAQLTAALAAKTPE